jgi:hypothetical protein
VLSAPPDHTYPGLPDPHPAAPPPPRPLPSPTPTNRVKLVAVPVLAAGLGFGLVAAVITVGGLRPRPPAASPAPSPSPRNLLVVRGGGTNGTRVFTTGTDWHLAYTFDCPRRGGFVVSEYSGSSTPSAVLVDSTTTKGAGAVPRRSDPGTHYLEVRSACSWTLTAIG